MLRKYGNITCETNIKTRPLVKSVINGKSYSTESFLKVHQNAKNGWSNFQIKSLVLTNELIKNTSIELEIY